LPKIPSSPRVNNVYYELVPEKNSARPPRLTIYAWNAYMILFDSYTSQTCCRGFLKEFSKVKHSEIMVNYQ
jgi:hypothetical protein